MRGNPGCAAPRQDLVAREHPLRLVVDPGSPGVVEVEGPDDQLDRGIRAGPRNKTTMDELLRPQAPRARNKAKVVERLRP